MPLFHPGRALSLFLRRDPFVHTSSPIFARASASPLSRLVDDALCNHACGAPMYTVFKVRGDDSNRSTSSNDSGSQKDGSQQAVSGQTQLLDNLRDKRLDHRHRRRQQLRQFNDPFSLFDAFSPFPFSSTFGSLLSHPFLPVGGGQVRAMPDITLDVFSTEKAYNIHAAVPGLDKRDIKVTVDDGVLRIEAERKEEKKQRQANASTAPTTEGATATAPEAAKDSNAATATTPSSEAPVSSGEGESDSVDYHHVESFYGKVVRSLTLPDDAEAEKLTARYENGVIKIEIPRVAERKKEPRTIDIQ